MHGRTLGDDSPVRPAECHWHLVFVRKDGEARVVFVGPWTTAGITHYTEGAEILWVKFGLGTFMTHLPVGRFLDTETILLGASSRSFWLKGSAWSFPDHENAETFVERLARNGVLARDPLVAAVLRGRPQGWSPRTVRHRFSRATGLTQSDFGRLLVIRRNGRPLEASKRPCRAVKRCREAHNTPKRPPAGVLGSVAIALHQGSARTHTS